MADIPANTTVDYTAPQYYTDAATAAAGGIQDLYGDQGYLKNVQQNWYDQPLSTGVTQDYQTAINQFMQPNTQWTQGVEGAQNVAQGATNYFNQASGALSPWGTTIGSGLSMLGQTTNAVNPYLSGMNQYQTLGQNAMTGYGTAQNYLSGTQGATNPYLSSTDAAQQQAQQYAGQAGQGLGGVQAGQQTVSGALPYLQQAAGAYGQGANYDPSQLNQYLNPYTQDAAQATVEGLNRNLTENLLPGVNSTFAGAGQFGSTRNADFEGRAIRDTQDAAAKALASANYGAYNSAQQAYSDWANKSMQAGQGLAGLAGQQSAIGQAQGSLGTQQSNIINQQAQTSLQNAGLDQQQAGLVSSMFQNLAQTQGSLSNQQVANYLQQAGLDQAQAGIVAQMYPQIASAYGSLGSQYGNISGAYSNLGTGALAQAGALGQLAGTGGTLSQQNLSNMMTGAQAGQTLQQSALDKAYQDWMTQTNFPMSAMSSTSGALTALKPSQQSFTSTGAEPTNIDKLASVLGILNTGANDSTINSLLNWIGTSDLSLTGGA